MDNKATCNQFPSQMLLLQNIRTLKTTVFQEDCVVTGDWSVDCIDTRYLHVGPVD